MQIKPSTKFDSIESYHSVFSPEVQSLLQQMFEAIQSAAPKATPCISYNMPAFRQGKVLVYYAAAKSHIGFYPTPGAITVFADDLKPYVTSKGAIRFPIDKGIPIDLVKRMVKWRVKEVS